MSGTLAGGSELNVALLGALIRDKRKKDGLTLRDAGPSCGIGFSTLSRLERGRDAKPDVETLERLCSWLGIATGILFSKSETVQAHLRARKNLSSETAHALRELIEAAQRQFEAHPIKKKRGGSDSDPDDDVRDDLDDDVVPSETPADWEATAKSIRADLDLDVDDPLDPFALSLRGVAKALASEIEGMSDSAKQHLLGEGAREWDATTIPLKDEQADWLIVLNNEHAQARQRATLMEEYCHVLLGHEMSHLSAREGVAFRDYLRGQEHQAYYVGAALLVPEDALRKRLRKRESAAKIASHFGVSAELVEFRIKRLGLWYVYRLRLESSGRALRKSGGTGVSRL
jgi:transcriptional regulator with XRE-family HTH domain